MEFKQYLLSNDFDIFCISETWLNSTIPDNSVIIEGYNILRRDRSDSRGGGVAMYIKKSIDYSPIPSSRNIEQIWVNINMKKIKFAIGVLYRAPLSNVKNFLDVFESDVSGYLSSSDECICLGDFNFDFLKPDSFGTSQFVNLIDSLNLTQIIEHPT